MLKEVSKDKFFGLIKKGNLNVHPRIVGPYPYTSKFIWLSAPNRPGFGEIREEVVSGVLRKRYFIRDGQ